MSATKFMERDILTVVDGSTEATVTSAPARRSVSTMHDVSISSEPLPMGTRTRCLGVVVVTMVMVGRGEMLV